MASVKCRADDKFGIQAGRARGFTVAPGVPHLVNGAAMSDKGQLCGTNLPVAGLSCAE